MDEIKKWLNEQIKHENKEAKHELLEVLQTYHKTRAEVFKYVLVRLEILEMENPSKETPKKITV